MMEGADQAGAETAFDPDTVQIMASAFDRAWDSLVTSRAAALFDTERARDLLGRCIIQAASDGERDEEQLCAEALLRLARSDLTMEPRARG
jgi:hypothetical protein